MGIREGRKNDGRGKYREERGKEGREGRKGKEEKGEISPHCHFKQSSPMDYMDIGGCSVSTGHNTEVTIQY